MRNFILVTRFRSLNRDSTLNRDLLNQDFIVIILHYFSGCNLRGILNHGRINGCKFIYLPFSPIALLCSSSELQKNSSYEIGVRRSNWDQRK